MTAVGAVQRDPESFAHLSNSRPIVWDRGANGAAAEELGGVDKVSDPQSDGCDDDEAEEAVGGLVVSGSQSSAVFEL